MLRGGVRGGGIGAFVCRLGGAMCGVWIGCVCGRRTMVCVRVRRGRGGGCGWHAVVRVRIVAGGRRRVIVLRMIHAGVIHARVIHARMIVLRAVRGCGIAHRLHA